MDNFTSQIRKIADFCSFLIKFSASISSITANIPQLAFVHLSSRYAHPTSMYYQRLRKSCGIRKRKNRLDRKKIPDSVKQRCYVIYYLR